MKSEGKSKALTSVLCSVLFGVTTGCQDKAMSKFRDRSPVMLTDEEGNTFVAEHHIGNTYLLKPLTRTK